MSFRIVKDSFFAVDKIFHLCRDAIIFLILRIFFVDIFTAFLTVIFAILWEIKDGLIPYELFELQLKRLTSWLPHSVSNFIVVHCNPGGNGFSYKDILAGMVGVIILLLIFRLI